MVPSSEIETIANQDNINLIISGMTALLQDTDGKVSVIENQPWYKRMIFTVFGKNKVTKAEIQRNKEKLDAYMAEALVQLYRRGCVHEEVMMSLGTQINQIYSEQNELKQMLGAFVDKLNQKINSVDNFHMLNTEIEQGVYSSYPNVLAIYKILELIDRRTVEDSRKMDILRRSMVQAKILNDKIFTVYDYILNIIQMPDSEIGSAYLFSQNLPNSFAASLVVSVVENYSLLPEMTKRIKDTSSVAGAIAKEKGLNEEAALTSNDVFDDLCSNYLDAALNIPNTEEKHDDLSEAIEQFKSCDFDTAYEQFRSAANEERAEAMYFLGRIYEEGLGHRNVFRAEGMKWFEKGGELGNTPCRIRAIENEPGLLTKWPDTIKALEVSSDPFALLELGKAYLNGDKVEKDEDRGKEILTELMEGGSFSAAMALFWHYKDSGKYDKAFETATRASELNFFEGDYALSFLYLNGLGTQADLNTAFDYARRCVEKSNYSFGYNCLGVIYSNATFSLHDDAKAVECYKKAIEADANSKCAAYYNLGCKYYNGEGIAQNYQESLSCFERDLQNRGYNNSAAYGAYCASRKIENWSLAYKYAKLGAEEGYAILQNNLGYLYNMGRTDEGGIDLEKARLWYKKASNQNDGIACWNMSTVVPYDEQDSWIDKAIENGFSRVQDYVNWSKRYSGKFFAPAPPLYGAQEYLNDRLV